uniref:Uncharacterized protein n=1 Tax=viral metagenome TaxID=1070528 RepID=A0A6C0J3J7_9ZZZZ
MWPVAAVSVAAVAAYSYFSGPRNTTTVRGSDGHDYQMQNLPDKDKAVELMVDIRKRLGSLRDYYASEPALAADPPIARFLANYKDDVFAENDVSSADTSYSENKGQRIVVCLRDKTRPPYPLIDINTIMFVMLHEMSHLMTETIGHTPEFWLNFKRALGDALKVGIYQQVNYAQSPVKYCGMTITDSPL